MASTYAQIQKKIALLQRQADMLRDKEIAGVIDRIKVAISHYGLTSQQLGFGASGAAPKAATGGKKKPAGVRYSDGAGGNWSGRGPRPRWLREALASGKAIEDFIVSGASGIGAGNGAAAGTGKRKGARPAGKATVVRAKRRPSSVLYQDGAGHSWTGRGPQPRWLKEALAQGKTLSELAS